MKTNTIALLFVSCSVFGSDICSGGTISGTTVKLDLTPLDNVLVRVIEIGLDGQQMGEVDRDTSKLNANGTAAEFSVDTKERRRVILEFSRVGSSLVQLPPPPTLPSLRVGGAFGGNVTITGLTVFVPEVKATYRVPCCPQKIHRRCPRKLHRRFRWASQEFPQSACVAYDTSRSTASMDQIVLDEPRVTPTAGERQDSAFRYWTNLSATLRVRARLVHVRNGMATFELKNGRSARCRVERLSRTDQVWIRQSQRLSALTMKSSVSANY